MSRPNSAAWLHVPLWQEGTNSHSVDIILKTRRGNREEVTQHEAGRFLVFINGGGGALKLCP